MLEENNILKGVKGLYERSCSLSGKLSFAAKFEGRRGLCLYSNYYSYLKS